MPTKLPINTAFHGQPVFPCPVCVELREVRLTKKKKPYVTCDPCGIQMFVRGPAGISAFQRLVDSGHNEGIWSAVKNMEPQYHLKCPACGSRFWIKPSLAKTSFFDGSLQGFRCPEKNCGAVVPWGEGS
jgi:transcription elongation factor Elf1